MASRLLGLRGRATVMSSPDTLQDDTPGSELEGGLLHEESLLKQKVSMLEAFLENDGRRESTVQERCRSLRRRIGLMNRRIAEAGLTAAADGYLKDPPPTEFMEVTQHDFLTWLTKERSSSESVDGQRLMTGSKRRGSHSSSSGFHVFSSIEQDFKENSRRPKRLRTIEKEKSPCLRCRILKKRCDLLEQCSHCPLQGYDSGADFWKILGCFRGHLSELSEIFCPGFARSTRRTLRYVSGGSETLNFVLTQSRVSDQKRRRMMHLVQTNPEFAQLLPSAWEDINNRKSVSLAGISMSEYSGDADALVQNGFLLSDYEAAWSVLQALSMDSVYLTKTEYNFFVLIRLGNEFSKNEAGIWESFSQAKRLLRQSVELYLLERLCSQMASGYMMPPFDPLSSTPNTLVLVDMKDSFETFLNKFERACIGRAKLTGSRQIACFYALLVLGIAKTVLIDSYSIRSGYEDPNPWKDEHAVKIISAYKALVSIFCWSSKLDIMLQSEGDVDNATHKAIQDTRDMLHTNRWDDRGIKGTKDFLLNLGSSYFSDGSFNGFFVQKFELENVPRIFPKVAGILNRGLGRRERRSHDKAREPQVTPGSSPSISEQSNEATAHDFNAYSKHASSTDAMNESVEQEFTFTALENFAGRDSFRNVEKNNSLGNPSARSLPTFTFVLQDENGNPASGRGQSRRTGALDAQTLVKAREMRRVGACWNCWVMKIPCSVGAVCDRCSKKPRIPVYQLCSRSPFVSYTDLFFPDFLTSPFSHETIKAYIKENTLGFTDEAISIGVTRGTQPWITFPASIFISAPDGEVQKTYYSRHGYPLGVESLPIGLRDSQTTVVEEKILGRIRSGMKAPNFIDHASNYDSSPFANLVNRAVFQFYVDMGTKHPLIEDLIVFMVTVCAARRPAVFTESSAESIIERLPIKPPSAQLYSSRLLNVQIKQLLNAIGREFLSKSLSRLEKLVRSRDKSSWPIHFAAILLICLCIERIQGHTCAYIETARLTEQTPILESKDDPHHACQLLDDVPYAQLEHLFHSLYRTSKGEMGGLNPFVDWFNGEEHGFDVPGTGLIREIKEKVMDNVELLKERDKPLSFGDPTVFMENNSGRLAARFLLGFV